ncbi:MULTISPECIES: hypothetical protein [Staphylococcus]|uniref:hypothetical protein n=1 Tax=Staphylococcus TaxID=1279 RepID=UPI0011CC4EA3|nr:hypothetical protein [Staphylococcus xylosus]
MSEQSIVEIIKLANYYLNEHNTGNLDEDNASDSKGKALLNEAVQRIMNDTVIHLNLNEKNNK